MTTPSKDFRRWLSFQNTPRHWDQWERGIVERLVRKAFEAGRKYERPVIVPANVMSSPKSVSVPAVAGGGEGVEPERVKTARKTVAELNNTSHECFEALGIISDYEKDACIASLEEEVAQLRFLTTTENGEALVISDLTEEVRDLRAAARPVDSVYADLLAKDRDVETLLAQDNEITRKEKEQALNRLLCAAQAARPADSALVDRLVKATKAFQNTVRSWIPATTHSMARIAKIQSAELLDVLEEYDAAQAPRPAEPKS